MKRLFPSLLALLMIASLCACGKEEPSIRDSLNKASSTGTSSQSSPESKPASPTTSSEPTSKVESEPEAGKVELSTSMFTLSYPEEDGWVYNEEDLEGSRWYTLRMKQTDADGNTIGYVMIDTTEEECGGYRTALHNTGFDAYDLVVNGAYERYTIGGKEFVCKEDSFGNRWYYGRDEASGVTLKLSVSDLSGDEKVDRLLDGLTFTLQDCGNVDPPWPWNGTPYQGEDLSATVGSVTIQSQWLPIDKPLTTFDTFDHDIEVVGDKAYIVSGDLMREYAYDGSSLTLLQEIPLEGDYKGIDAKSDGTLLLNSFGYPLLEWKDGETLNSYSGLDYFAAAPDGSWGISYFVSSECSKVTLSNGEKTTEPISFPEVESMSYLRVDDKYIYACGNSAETDQHTAYVYDHSGKLQKTLEGDDMLGSLTYITETKNGFLGMDGNMREIVLWDKDGNFLGDVDDRDIFGTNYPWFCASDIQPDGSIIVIMTEDRQDDSSMELIAYRLTGF